MYKDDLMNKSSNVPQEVKIDTLAARFNTLASFINQCEGLSIEIKDKLYGFEPRPKEETKANREYCVEAALDYLTETARETRDMLEKIVAKL
jgi:transposase